MANDVTALNKEEWARNMQSKMYKELIAMRIGNFGIDADLRSGDKVHKPYISDFHVVTYTKGTDISNRQDATATDDYIDVATVECVPIYLDDVEQLQSSYALREAMAFEMQEDLNRRLDAVYLSEYDNAGADVDDGDYGGTAGTAHDFSTSDIDQMFSVAGKKLNLKNAKFANRFAVIGPSQYQLLQDLLSSKDSSYGDKVGVDGFVTSRFGFDIYVSNNLTFTARWTPADNPTTAATITIAGVTITFLTTPSAAGQVDVGASTAATLDNLVALLNNSSGYAAGEGLATSYFEFSQADRAVLDSVVATDGTTYLGIECVGMGEVVVATSEAADLWSLHTLHCVAGVKRETTTMVVQKQPGIKVVADPDRLGDNLTAWMLYGVKTFTKDALRLVDINVDASGFATSSSA